MAKKLVGLTMHLDDGSTIDVNLNDVQALAWGEADIDARIKKDHPYKAHKIHCKNSLSVQEVIGVCQWIYPPGYWDC